MSNSTEQRMTYEEYFAKMRLIHDELTRYAERTLKLALTGQGNSDEMKAELERHAALVAKAAELDAEMAKARGD